MKVKELIRRLRKENPEEEVVFIVDDDRSSYYLLEFAPFLHAGPRKFKNKHGTTHMSSVVVIRALPPSNKKG
tara:strand:- start:363 stop:578 length:216 start_codon:yes stop_codon:yes gene_type:complete